MERNRRAALCGAALLGISAFLVYIPSLWNGFVNWDDPSYVYKNPRLGGFDLVWIFTARVVGNWHPLTLLSFDLDHLIWGLDPFGFHLTNSVIHSFNTFLVGALSYRVALSVYGGKLDARTCLVFVSVPAMLFGLHPLHVESVAWISERKDVLSSFFVLLSLVLYFLYAEGRLKRLWYSAILASFALALMSKPMAVTVPLLFLVLDFFPLERIRGLGSLPGLIIEKLPFFAMSAGISFVTLWAQKEAGAVDGGALFVPQAATAFRAVVFYVYKTIAPAGLAPYYPVDFDTGISTLILYGAAVTALTLLALYLLKWSRGPLAAWLFYIAALLPVSGMIKFGEQAAADRYAYLPTVALFVLAGGAVSSLSRKSRLAIPAVAAVMVSAGAVMAYATVLQAAVWKGSLTLWSHELKHYPGVAIAHINRGIANGELGRYDDALTDFSNAVRLNPEEPKAYYNRARALSLIGRDQESIADLTVAIGLNPSYEEAYLARGVAYASRAEYGRAISDFKKVIDLRPDNLSALFNIGLAYMRAGDKDGAAFYFKAAAERGSREAASYLTVGQHSSP
ncbi:MAG: tetratricopeptide repeat protein [Candidatus Methylomirabilis sp.]|nr:tetratricopeptide repeat protein [Deltaproteobacteria bacterium]